MQVAAADPRFVSRDEVTSETLDKEKDIQRAAPSRKASPRDRRQSGGRPHVEVLREVCLLEQPFIKENAVSITQLLADKGKQLGDTLSVASFLRFKVGETGQAEEAAE